MEDALHASLGAALGAAACPAAAWPVFCLVIADDPTAAQRCALNAASLALLDARAPMRHTPRGLMRCEAVPRSAWSWTRRATTPRCSRSSRAARGQGRWQGVRRAGEEAWRSRAAAWLAGGR